MTATVTTSTGVGTATFSALAPGTYTVSESPNADFVLLAAGCVPGSGPNTMATQTVTVSAGVPAACSYSNTKKGSVVVTKNTTGGDGTFIFTLSNGVTMTATVTTSTGVRTEERRVGKEGRSRWSPDH